MTLDPNIDQHLTGLLCGLLFLPYAGSAIDDQEVEGTGIGLGTGLATFRLKKGK